MRSRESTTSAKNRRCRWARCDSLCLSGAPGRYPTSSYILATMSGRHSSRSARISRVPCGTGPTSIKLSVPATKDTLMRERGSPCRDHRRGRFRSLMLSCANIKSMYAKHKHTVWHNHDGLQGISNSGTPEQDQYVDVGHHCNAHLHCRHSGVVAVQRAQQCPRAKPEHCHRGVCRVGYPLRCLPSAPEIPSRSTEQTRKAEVGIWNLFWGYPTGMKKESGCMKCAPPSFCHLYQPVPFILHWPPAC